MNDRKWYIPLFILLVMAFVPWLKEVERYNKFLRVARLENAPKYSPEKARAEHAWIIEKETAWIRKSSLPDTPSSYWNYLERRIMLQDALARLSATLEVPTSIEFQTRLTQMDSAPVHRIRTIFGIKFGEMEINKTKPKGMYFDRPALEIDSHGVEKFGLGYLYSIPVMFLVFVVRLRVRELMVLPEIWRLIPASIFWPIGLFLYPRDLRREQQMKSAMNFVAQFASALITLIGAGPLVPIMKAQINKSGKGGIERTERKSSHSFAYGVEFYPQSTGIDKGLMIAPWYAHSHQLGKGFTFSGFGFIEAGERRGQLFSNHISNFSHEKARGAMFTWEVGGTAKGAFLGIGPRFNLMRLPLFPKDGKKIVKSVVAGSMWQIRGPTRYQEFFLTWGSQEARLPLGWRLSTEGFMRFRPGARTNVGQPQLLLRHPRIPHTQFVAEFWMIGTQPTVRLGLQFSK